MGMKRMPSLRFSVRYDTRKAIPQGWKGVPPFKLACGAVSSLVWYLLGYEFTNMLGRSARGIASMETLSMAGMKMRGRIC